MTERKPKACSYCEKRLNPHKRREPICFECYSAIRQQTGHLNVIAVLRKENEAMRLLLKRAEHTRNEMPRDVLNKLIRLVHPDRHNNSQAANEATAWLLLQRGAVHDAG